MIVIFTKYNLDILRILFGLYSAVVVGYPYNVRRKSEESTSKTNPCFRKDSKSF